MFKMKKSKKEKKLLLKEKQKFAEWLLKIQNRGYSDNEQVDRAFTRLELNFKIK